MASDSAIACTVQAEMRLVASFTTVAEPMSPQWIRLLLVTLR
jgi:hypothetical protein